MSEFDLTPPVENSIGGTSVAAQAAHPASLSFRPPSMLYDSGEHVLLGNTCTLHFPSGDQPGTMRLALYLDWSGSPFHNAAPYSFGDILALAGDFIGDPDHPISDAPDPLAQFEANYSQLCDLASNDPNQINAILDLIHQEVTMLNQLQPGQDPSTVYDRIGDSFSLKWNIITGGTNARIVPLTNGRYLALALKNWDHFGQRAVLSYAVGHQAAMNAAMTARTANSPELAEVWLQVAYATDAFACHFLTDLFSSGHLRTPRKELDTVSTNSSTAGLLARAMHDQDSKIGLTVSNQEGQTWTAYGDGHLLSTDNGMNSRIAQAAVQVSVDEIYATFQSGQLVPAPGALRKLPDLDKIYALNAHGKSPLFVSQRDAANSIAVQVRNSASLDDYSWTGSWHEATTLLWCIKEGLIKLPGT